MPGSAAGAVAARDWAARAAAAPGSPAEASNGSAVYIQGLRPAQRRVEVPAVARPRTALA